MRRPLIALAATIVALGVFAAGLAWLLDTTNPRPGAPRAERLYDALCATCHGADGRGSWRAALFLIDPGDLSDPARMRQHTDQYLFEIIKNGGSPLGRPGMPAFGHLSDDDIRALVAYVRTLGHSKGATSQAPPYGAPVPSSLPHSENADALTRDDLR